MSTRAWIGLMMAVCLGLGGWWAVENLTIEEVRVPGRPHADVLRNPYYVAQKLMVQSGAQVESRYGHRGVPPGPAQGAVLFLPIERRTLAASQSADILEWVRAGGHLVILATPPQQVQAAADGRSNAAGDSSGDEPRRDPLADPLLSAIGVSAEAVRMKRTFPNGRASNGGVSPSQPDAEEGSGAAEAVAEDEDDLPASAMPAFFPSFRQGKSKKDCTPHAEGGSGPRLFPAQWIRLCLSPRTRLVSARPPLWQVHSSRGDHAVTHALGEGRVSVLVTAQPFMNWSIDQGDHADFLSALLGGRLQGLRVTIVIRDDVDNLAWLAWEHAAGVVIALILLVLGWLWWAATRLGPVDEPMEPRRRSLQEHVRAIGELFWREGNARALWEASAGRTRRIILRKVPHFADDTLLVAHLARRTGLPRPDLEFALNPGDVSDPHDFVRAISTLEQLRKSL